MASEDDDDITPYLQKPKVLEYLKKVISECHPQTNTSENSGQSLSYLERQNEMLLQELMRLKGLSTQEKVGPLTDSNASGEPKQPISPKSEDLTPANPPKTKPFWR